MNVLSNINKLKAFIAPKITKLITFIDDNVNRLSSQGGLFVDSIGIYKLLDIQIHWPLQFSALIILVPHIPPTMIQ